MEVDRNGLEVLGHTECLALMRTVPLGRVVFTDQALPAIQPVNFVLDGSDVVIRTSPGSKLALATRGAIVAFEADEFDSFGGTGWSVTMVGQARPVRDTTEVERLSKLPLDPWAPGPLSSFVRIRCQQISGRRIHAATA